MKMFVLLGLVLSVIALPVCAEAEEDSDEGSNKWYDKIDFSFKAIGVIQGSSGVRSRLSPEGDVTDAAISFDFELSAPIGNHGLVYALIEAGSGDGIDGNIPTFSGFFDEADGDADLDVTEFWYEHRFWNNKWALKVGKISLSGPVGCNECGFDANAIANDGSSQFLSPGFVNTLALEFPEDNGFGLALWFSPHELVDIGIGYGDADADWDNVFDDPFAIVEIDFKPKLADRQGNYRVYGWLNGMDHDELTHPAETGKAGWGFGVSCDHELCDGCTIFARYGWQRGSLYEVEHALSAGVQFSGKYFGRENDHIGLAYGLAILGGDYKQTVSDPGDEHHFEAYYQLHVNENLSISPDVQWVRNPNGDTDNDDVWVFGIRGTLSF